MASFEETHGFPPDANTLTLATADSHRSTDALVELTPIPSDLTTLYWVLAEASLPDIHTGCFLHPASLVAAHVREHGHVAVPDDPQAIVFASDGGGHLFALSDSRRVWRSTAASWSAGWQPAATGLKDFLEQLSHMIGPLPR